MPNTKRSLLYLWTLVASLVFLTTASFARDLYWTEQQIIKASDIDGQNVTVIFDGATSTPAMGGNAVDLAVTATHIYWSGHSGGDIWRANRDGTGAVQLITGGTSVHFLAINETSGKIYFTDFSTGLFYANLADGSGNTNYYNGHPGNFTGVVVDPAATFTDEVLAISTANEWLYRATPEWGSVGAQAALEGGNATYGLALDHANRTIYYTNYTEHTLRSYNLTTGQHELLWTPGMASPLGVKLSPSGTHLLIAERGRGITGYEIATGGYELLVASADAHFGVAVTADPGTLVVPPPPPPPPPPAEDGDALFTADFEADTAGDLPKLDDDGGVWRNWVPRTTPDSVYVVTDENDLFGYGTENQFLRVHNAIGSYMDAVLSEASEVVTMSFDFIARRTSVGSSGSERNGFGFFHSNIREHLYSVNGTGTLRSGSGTQPVNQRARVDVVFNNSAVDVQYQAPDETMHTIPSVHAAIWINGELLSLHAAYGRGATAAVGHAIEMIRVPHFSSTDRHSIDIDNFTVFKGAHVFKPLVEGFEPDPNPPVTFWGHLNATFDGIPLGDITRASFGAFLHGNLSGMSFHTRYDTNTPDTDDPDFVPSPLTVALDTENRFGNGTENQILRTQGARGWTLAAENNFNQEVMTLRIDMIAGPASNGRLTSRFFDADGNDVSRVELRTPGGSESGNINFVADGPDHGTWEYDVLNRFEWVVNNSADALVYSTPSGGSKTLISGGTDLWINGNLTYSDSTYLRTATAPGPIMRYTLNTFSTNPWDGDIDLVRTYAGVQLEGVTPPEGGFSSWQEQHFPGETDPAIIGPDADADRDGIRNLLEYALGSDPNDAGRDSLPLSGIATFTVEGVEAQYLTLTFTRPDSILDLSYDVFVSSDLATWAATAVLEETIGNGDGTTTYIYRDSEPLGSSERRFMALEVAVPN